MARFVVPVTIELQVEAETVQEAVRKFNHWRKFVMAALRGRLAEAGVHRISIKTSREFTEVDAAWLENHYLRRKFQREWEYETREEPVVPGSQLMLTHRTAVGPKASGASEAPAS